MPRGDNPNSRKNLKPVGSVKEAREKGRKGGKKSAQVRKEFASFRECFKASMDDEKRQEMFDMLYGRAKRGNLKAFELLRDTLGENPNNMPQEKEQMESDGFIEMMENARCKAVDDGEMVTDE